jgi:hypothetical protein
MIVTQAGFWLRLLLLLAVVLVVAIRLFLGHNSA